MGGVRNKNREMACVHAVAHHRNALGNILASTVVHAVARILSYITEQPIHHALHVCVRDNQIDGIVGAVAIFTTATATTLIEMLLRVDIAHFHFLSPPCTQT